MHLYETPEGDRWVCENCAREQEPKLKAENWEFIFDRFEQDLVCALCQEPEYVPED